MGKAKMFNHLDGDVDREFESVYTGLTEFNVTSYTTDERDDLEPDAGQLIYNTTTNKLNIYTGSAWEVITSA